MTIFRLLCTCDSLLPLCSRSIREDCFLSNSLPHLFTPTPSHPLSSGKLFTKLRELPTRVFQPSFPVRLFVLTSIWFQNYNTDYIFKTITTKFHLSCFVLLYEFNTLACLLTLWRPILFECSMTSSFRLGEVIISYYDRLLFKLYWINFQFCRKYLCIYFSGNLGDFLSFGTVNLILFLFKCSLLTTWKRLVCGKWSN